MNNTPREKLKHIITQYGRDICEDARRCEAMLRDLCPECKREINVLVSALKDGVAEELMKISASTPKEVMLARLSQRLYDNIGMSEEFAHWAVDSWAMALGIISRPRTGIQPTSKQQPVQQSQIVQPASSLTAFDKWAKLKRPPIEINNVNRIVTESASAASLSLEKQDLPDNSPLLTAEADGGDDLKIHTIRLSNRVKITSYLRKIVFACLIAGIGIGAGLLYFELIPNPFVSESKTQFDLLKDPPPDSSVKIYSWIDKNGVYRFSDEKPKDPDVQVTESFGYKHQEESLYRRSVNKIKKLFQNG